MQGLVYSSEYIGKKEDCVQVNFVNKDFGLRERKFWERRFRIYQPKLNKDIKDIANFGLKKLGAIIKKTEE